MAFESHDIASKDYEAQEHPLQTLSPRPDTGVAPRPPTATDDGNRTSIGRDDTDGPSGLDEEKGEDSYTGLNSVGDPEEDEYPHGMKLALIITSVLLAIFLVALDRTIIATAIPKISDHFKSLDDIGWYGSAYMLTNAALQLLFGRIYKFYSTKWVFLGTIAVFEIGSAICGAAPTSTALIIGRAIAGAGSAGIFSGGMLIITFSVPLHKRPLYSGFFGSVFGLSSVIGPLLGGAFTDSSALTWRWCFYINLPIGAVTLVVLFFILNVPEPPESRLSLKDQLYRLDPIGTIVFLPCAVCLLLALQWGGTTYAWGEWRVVLLLVISAVLGVVFVGIQIWKGEEATVPPRIMKMRSIAFGTVYSFCVASAMMILVYYIPIWFQAIKNTTAVESGIRTIPLVLSLVVSSIIGGIITTRIGYYVPSMLICPCVMAIGAGLITTWAPTTPSSQWIGYQVLFGLGLGLGMQTSNLAAQTVLSKADIPIGTTLMMFAQQLGGAVFISVGQNVFTNKLADGVTSLPGVDNSMVMETGATDLQQEIPAQYLPEVLSLYNDALVKAFVVATAMSAVTILGAVGMEWKSIKKRQPAVVAATTAADVVGEVKPGNAASETSQAGPENATTNNHTETTSQESFPKEATGLEKKESLRF